MSGPYVFTPTPPTHSLPYTTPYYTYTQPSPFIPDGTIYPYSPYSSPFGANTPLPSISPHLVSGPLPDPDSDDANTSKFPKWTTLRPQARKRTLSWNTGANVYEQYLSPQSSSSVLPTFSTPNSTTQQLEHTRRRSFGNTQAPPLYYTIWSHWEPYFPPQPHGYPWPVPPSQVLIHPYLNYHAQQRGEFFFDFAMPTFSPMRLVAPGKSVLLDTSTLEELATCPSVTSLHIVCDLIPNWPVDLRYEGSPHSTPPPITVGDVLSVIHSKLHERISHADWALLSKEQEYKIAKAYTRRCKNSGSIELSERASGVKRVDYLMGRTRFGGLVWSGDGGVKLVVS